MKTTASSAPVAARRAVSSCMPAASTGPGSGSIHGSRHSMISSTPGSSSAAARPRGPQSMTTRSAPAATARIAGPVTRTSPAESGRATSTQPGRRRSVPWAADPATRRCRRRIRSTAPVRSPATAGAAATSSARVTGVGTRIPAAPAATAAVMSRPMSPTTTQRSGVVPSAAAAAWIIPGAGFRHRQFAESSCGHTCHVSNGPRSSSTLACTAASSSAVNRPRARPDWLVTTPIRNPAARSRSSAARAPGTGSTRAGSPLYGTSTTRVPSRSNSTASNRLGPGGRALRGLGTPPGCPSAGEVNINDFSPPAAPRATATSRTPSGRWPPAGSLRWTPPSW